MHKKKKKKKLAFDIHHKVRNNAPIRRIFILCLTLFTSFVQLKRIELWQTYKFLILLMNKGRQITLIISNLLHNNKILAQTP